MGQTAAVIVAAFIIVVAYYIIISLPSHYIVFRVLDFMEAMKMNVSFFPKAPFNYVPVWFVIVVVVLIIVFVWWRKR